MTRHTLSLSLYTKRNQEKNESKSSTQQVKHTQWLQCECAKNINLMRTKHVSFQFPRSHVMKWNKHRQVLFACDVRNEKITRMATTKHSNCSWVEKLAALSALEFREFYSMRLSNSSPVDFFCSHPDRFLPSSSSSPFPTMTLRYSNCWLPCWHPHSWYGPDDKVKYAQKEQKNHFSVVVGKTNGPCSTHTEQTETKSREKNGIKRIEPKWRKQKINAEKNKKFFGFDMIA